MPTMHLPLLGSPSLATLISRSLLPDLCRNTERGLPVKDETSRLEVAPAFVAMYAYGQYPLSLFPGAVSKNDVFRVT